MFRENVNETLGKLKPVDLLFLSKCNQSEFVVPNKTTKVVVDNCKVKKLIKLSTSEENTKNTKTIKNTNTYLFYIEHHIDS